MTASDRIREAREALKCPECGEEVWDLPYGSKLAKCWNTEGHESGGTLAFDTMDDEDDEDDAVSWDDSKLDANCEGRSFRSTL